MNISWSTFQIDEWVICLAATERGLCYLAPATLAKKEFFLFMQKRIPRAVIEERRAPLLGYIEEIAAYLQGKRRIFDLLLDLHGTTFQSKVWSALQTIPYGETTTYTAIASAIGQPKAVRAVGTAIGANPIMIIVPCHRVIGKDGSLTGFRGGLDMKKRLLQLEGGMLHVAPTDINARNQ